MPTMRAQFQRHLFPGLNALLFNSYKERMPQYKDLFRVDPSSSAFEEFRTMAGTGLFVRTPEGVEPSQDRFYDGYPKRFTHEDYSSAIGFTHKFLRDIKTRIAGERVSDLGRSGRMTEETLISSLLNSAFDGAVLGPDGVALCSTAHPNIRGGTQSNIISPVGTLSITTLRRMLTAGRRFYDDTGVRRIQLDWKYLVVAPENEFAALEILNSAGRPDTANRADNVTKGKLIPYVYDFLTDAENFWMLADKSQHHLHVFFREKFNTREYEDEAARLQWVAAAMAFSYGWSHYMGVVGSNPS